MFPALKNNTDTGYQGPVKIELLKGAGLLRDSRSTKVTLTRELPW